MQVQAAEPAVRPRGAGDVPVSWAPVQDSGPDAGRERFDAALMRSSAQRTATARPAGIAASGSKAADAGAISAGERRHGTAAEDDEDEGGGTPAPARARGRSLEATIARSINAVTAASDSVAPDASDALESMATVLAAATGIEGMANAGAANAPAATRAAHGPATERLATVSDATQVANPSSPPGAAELAAASGVDSVEADASAPKGGALAETSADEANIATVSGGAGDTTTGIAATLANQPGAQTEQKGELGGGVASGAGAKSSHGADSEDQAVHQRVVGERVESTTGSISASRGGTNASPASDGEPLTLAADGAASLSDRGGVSQPTDAGQVSPTDGSPAPAVEDSVVDASVDASAGGADSQGGDAATPDGAGARNSADDLPHGRESSGSLGREQAANAAVRTVAVASELRASLGNLGQTGLQSQREPGDSDGPRGHEGRVDHSGAVPAEVARPGAASDGLAGPGGKGEAARPGGAASTIHLERALAAGAERDVVGRLRHDGEMRLTLEPRGLGELEVRVAVRDGGVHASVATTSDDARHLLASQRAHLETALERYNLRLDSFNVGVGGDGRPAFERDAHSPLAAGWQGGALASEVREPAHETPALLDGLRGGTLSIRA